MTLFEPVTATGLARIFYGRTLPVAILLLVGAPPFFVAMLDIRLEDVDFTIARCSFRANCVEYSAVDKVFDLLFILIVNVYSLIEFERSGRAEPWRWVPLNLALAAYRVLGIGIILATSQTWLNILFPNVWLPLFWLYTFLQYTGLYGAWLRASATCRRVVVGTAFLYKLVEEVLHFAIIKCKDDPSESAQCRTFTDGATEENVMRTLLYSSYFLVPVFVALIVQRWASNSR